MNELAPIETQEVAIWRPSPMMHPQRLAVLWDLSDKIAFSAAIPESLRGERAGNTFTPFEDRVILANVFAVVEQADRWNLSPLALMQSAAIVRGKLCYEGKTIAAVLEDQFGIELHAYYRGDPGSESRHIYLCDQKLPAEVVSELKPDYRHDDFKIMDGSVAEWKTSGNGSPWKPATYNDMLMYRGVRQWVRLYKSRVLLGVASIDEAQQAALESAAQHAVPVGQRFAPTGQGFNAGVVAAALEDQRQVPMEIVKDNETVQETTESGGQHSGDALKTTAVQQGDKPRSPAVPADDSAGGAGSTASGGSRPQDSTAPTADAPTGAVDGGDAGPAPARVSADIFLTYHQALARFDKKESVERGHKQFWAGKGIKMGHPDDVKLAKDIYDNHILRAEGQVTAAQLEKFVAGWVKEVAGDPL